ncbi:sulfate ABC transporter permease subunit CysT [Microbacterium protaetiae]|uniref:Sulfate transport system permease protein CysT n=1 Tax=Microbacterium protaetiae TaxID=2509458 RepID=A0A4P6EFA9_9MICO|nr:sulfate ABC transporter permease subunit CysT [Microbacterium protaetiae]QAY61052.1 sulfate ABC transporter permease subunit CysT [Microbacterium protaetiae]
MALLASANPASTRTGRRRTAGSARRLTRTTGLGLGMAMLWFSLLVLIPLAAVIVAAAGGGWSTFRDVLTDPGTVATLRFTLTTAVLVTLLNAVMGTLIAWLLVRDRFPGKALLDLVIDIPFAMPTIVAGLVLLALYGHGGPLGVDVSGTKLGVVLAIAFVTLPFVVRAVQPVLQALEADVEDAAASLGASRATIMRRIILPSLVPAITAGASLSFARAISEYGSVVLISMNARGVDVMSTETYRYIEGGDTAAAAAVAVILLVIALASTVVLDVLQRTAARRD